LLDLNVLIALTDPGHQHHENARRWFTSSGRLSWGICPLTEAGFLRVTTNPAFNGGTRTMQQAIAILQALREYPGFSYWEIRENSNWVSVTAPFAERILGHRQVTDAYLLGLAIKENAVLATFDKGVVFLAGAKYRLNVLLLE
jgi:toxin-antitoxin system PIN domain toxin